MSSSGNPTLTIYFRGFPEDITNSELEDVFLEYGNIIKCFVHKNRMYGMVEYDNLSSCEEAIRSLNGTPPLNLYMNMVKGDKNNTSMNDSRKSGGKTTNFNSHKLDSVDYKEQELFVDENGVVINVLQDPETNEIYVPIQYAPNIRRIVRKVPVLVNNSQVRNGNLSDDDCASVITTASAVRRRVNMDNSRNCPDITVERSFTENDDTGNNSRQNGILRGQPYGNRNSGGGGEMRPNRSTEPNHRAPYGGRALSESRSKENLNKQREPEQNMRRAVGPSDENKPRFNKNKFQGAGGDNQQKFPKRDFNKSKVPEADGDWDVTASSPVVEKKSFLNNSASPIEKKIPTTNITHELSTTPSNSSVINRSQFNKVKRVTYKTVDLPTNQFTEVEISHTVSDILGWAQISSEMEKVNNFMVEVMEIALKETKQTKPEVGKICLAQFENFWFRAVILSTSPKIKVRFIDYGNEAEVDEVTELLPKYSDVPAYAFCINLADGAPCKLQDGIVIKIKPVKIENDVVTVHVENGIYDKKPEPVPAPVPSTSSLASKIRPTHSLPSASSSNSLAACQEAMLKVLQPGMDGMLEMTIKLSSTKAVAFLLPELLITEAATLENISTQVQNTDSSSFKPKVGDLVVAKNEGWDRAIILKIENGFKVAFIDYGTIQTVSEVKPLPDDFKAIPQFSCVFTAPENKLPSIEEQNSELRFQITKIINNTVHCSLTVKGEDLCDISFVLWSPELESSGSKLSGRLSRLSSTSATSLDNVQTNPKKILTPQKLKLNNGDNVKLVDENKGFLYVQTKEAVDILKRVEKYISEYAPNAPKITEMPVVGQYVAAQFENAWYRAVVTNVNQNKADIFYIDYGNEEIKACFSLKHLDEYLCKEPCALIKIKLKGFVDKPFTAKCLKYFQNIAGNTVLKATYEGTVENGVDLTMKDGKNITDELNKLNAAPTPKPFQTRKEFYMKVNVPGNDDPRISSSSIKLEEIPIGKGKIRFLGEVDLTLNTISVCVTNPEMLHKVHVDLLDQMTKYVTHFAPNSPYTPVAEEVILVENRDKWYRAICLELEDKTSQISVFFIDYGFNLKVTADKIRRMPKEFMEYNALANFAMISGLPNTLSKNVTDRLQSLLERNEDYIVEVLDKDDEDSYMIAFPEIMLQLKSENLIK